MARQNQEPLGEGPTEKEDTNSAMAQISANEKANVIMNKTNKALVAQDTSHSEKCNSENTSKNLQSTSHSLQINAEKEEIINTQSPNKHSKNIDFNESKTPDQNETNSAAVINNISDEIKEDVEVIQNKTTETSRTAIAENIERPSSKELAIENANKLHKSNEALANENKNTRHGEKQTDLLIEENGNLVKQESVYAAKTNEHPMINNHESCTTKESENSTLFANVMDEESEEIVLTEESEELLSTSQESVSVIKDDKSSDSDAHSEDTNDEDIDVNINSNSQFYESSDSKLDYAVKIDDNDNDTLSDIEDIKTDSAVDSEDSALGSLPPDVALNEREEEGQDRSDGSDSGLGSETTDDVKISNFALELPCTSGLNIIEPSSDVIMEDTGTADDPADKDENESTNTVPKKPQKSSLKRKTESEHADEPQAKTRKMGLRFDKVTVYYFTRAQGFNCVPSQGGSTLGMEWQHSHVQDFTLAEHAIEQRRLHRQILQQLKNERHSLQGVSLSSSEDSDTEEEASDMSESELDLDNYYFLQPVPTRQRRALLRAAGVRKIEAYEKDECRDIRTSREFCGCACKGGCNPATCSCSLAGIKCQVDRLNFPCGCTRDGCKNTTGRIEFNPIRVRTHFIHTLMRIGIEKKNEEEAKRKWAESAAQQAASTSCAANTAVYDSSRCNIRDDGLVRDVSLTPQVEVESCVNAGSFSNIHCDMNNVSAAAPASMQEDMSYTYRAGNSHVTNQSVMQIVETNSLRNHHADPYSASMLQGKGPPYSIASTGFETMPHNVQRFPCDINYTYGAHDNHHFKSLQSFSASSFEEFAHAHNSHMAMFGNYAHYDYLQKQNSQQHPLQYHHVAQNHYDMYKAESIENKDSYYAPLMTLPYHSNKMQSVDDENWFSHNTLMAVEEQTQDAPEHPAPGPAPAARPDPAPAPAPADGPPDTNAETETENLGELIKKSMVESVSV